MRFENCKFNFTENVLILNFVATLKKNQREREGENFDKVIKKVGDIGKILCAFSSRNLRIV